MAAKQLEARQKGQLTPSNLCEVPACSAVKKGAKAHLLHWARTHEEWLREFLCPFRETRGCGYSSVHVNNMTRHVCTVHDSDCFSEMEAKELTQKKNLEVGEITNKHYIDPKGTQPPGDLSTFYEMEGLHPVLLRIATVIKVFQPNTSQTLGNQDPSPSSSTSELKVTPPRVLSDAVSKVQEEEKCQDNKTGDDTRIVLKSELASEEEEQTFESDSDDVVFLGMDAIEEAIKEEKDEKDTEKVDEMIKDASQDTEALDLTLTKTATADADSKRSEQMESKGDGEEDKSVPEENKELSDCQVKPGTSTQTEYELEEPQPYMRVETVRKKTANRVGRRGALHQIKFWADVAEEDSPRDRSPLGGFSRARLEELLDEQKETNRLLIAQLQRMEQRMIATEEKIDNLTKKLQDP